jgi:hypothetical protein
MSIVHRATERATGRGPGESLRVQKRLGQAEAKGGQRQRGVDDELTSHPLANGWRASLASLRIPQAGPHDLAAGGILCTADIGGPCILHLRDLAVDKAELDAAIAGQRLTVEV